MFGFEDMERNKAHAIAMARRSPRGMDKAQLVPGAVVTFSPNLTTGDRSYTDTIFEVLAFSGTQVVLKYRAGYEPYKRDRIMVMRHEHEFYPAEHVLDALAQDENTAKSAAGADVNSNPITEP